jgi:hypothetical protein
VEALSSTPDPRALPRLRRLLRVYAAQVLALPRRVLKGTVQVSLSDRYHEVGLLVRPRGGGASSQGGTPVGCFFSALEGAVFAALANGPLTGQAICQVIGEPYGARVKVLLANLVERGVLHNDRENGGYSRVPQGPLG